jgi:hypothetical protein
MLTPMSKYYASEMSIRVANDAVQVLGGSGYMTDYPVERYLRDARITTIYEGTSQLQIVAAVRGVCSGSFEKHADQFDQKDYTDELLDSLKGKLTKAKADILEAIKFVKERGNEYMDLYGRKLVDAAAVVLIGHLLLQQAAVNDRKKAVARRFIETGLPTVGRDLELICSGDQSALTEYDLIAGPSPVTS